MNCEAHDLPADERGECEECRIERRDRESRDWRGGWQHPDDHFTTHQGDDDV